MMTEKPEQPPKTSTAQQEWRVEGLLRPWCLGSLASAPPAPAAVSSVFIDDGDDSDLKTKEGRTEM